MSFMFKHWFEDDPDYVDENPPKMRENELHKPKIIKVEEKVGDCGSSVEFLGQCTVCGFTYSRNPDWINYCPKCGARLKEIDE